MEPCAQTATKGRLVTVITVGSHTCLYAPSFSNNYLETVNFTSVIQFVHCDYNTLFGRMVQKQLAFMLGRQQIFLELEEKDCPEADDLTEIMANVHLNNNFLNLAREVVFI